MPLFVSSQLPHAGSFEASPGPVCQDKAHVESCFWERKPDEHPLLETTSCISLEKETTQDLPAAGLLREEGNGASASEPSSIVVLGGVHDGTADTVKHVELGDMSDRISREDMNEIHRGQDRVGSVSVKEKNAFLLFKKPLWLNFHQEGNVRTLEAGNATKGADSEVLNKRDASGAREGVQQPGSRGCTDAESTMITKLEETVQTTEGGKHAQERKERQKGISSGSSCSDGECGRSEEMSPL